MKFLLLVGVAINIIACSDTLSPACKYPVYCNSLLLHHVQMARIFPDSKTFVDYHMREDANVTLAAFQLLVDKTNNNLTKDRLIQFVHQYFADESELVYWTPSDFIQSPDYFTDITDQTFRAYAEDAYRNWLSLSKKIISDVSRNPERYSIIPVSNGFIVPGGRYKELHYWDTYWIIKGLVISRMISTAHGMIENLIELQRTVGHIPSGGRWYYQERSQPPLLTAMVYLCFQQSADVQFLKNVIGALEEELNYWLDTQTAFFSKNNKTYKLLRYYAPSAGPRPESYFEDYTHSLNLSSTEKETFFTELKSAAESGWEFSSRWFIDPHGENTGSLLNTKIDSIIPVDLNAIFANALQNVSHFQMLLFNRTSAEHWDTLAKEWRSNIEEVFWNDDVGVWLDYDVANQKHRNYFYPSNLAPLWIGVVKDEDVAKRSPRIIQYLHKTGVLNYSGGVPTSLLNTGEQWDLPNAWPPLVSIVVNAVAALGTEESKNISFKIAQNFMRATLKRYSNNYKIFDRYNAKDREQPGIGKEYEVQEGFGWTIGVILELLAKYPDMTHSDIPSYYEVQAYEESLNADASVVMV